MTIMAPRRSANRSIRVIRCCVCAPSSTTTPSSCSTSGTTRACSPRPAPSTACAPSRSAPTAPSWAAPWASTGCQHIVNAYDLAIEEHSPIVGIWHSGGARLAEGVAALHAVGLVFEAMIRASGYIPQISVVVGFAAGGAAYGPALTDVVIMAPEGRIFVTGPDVVRSVTGEDVDMESLGGPDTHHKKSGVCHIVADDELDAYARGRRLVGLFCQQGHFDRSKAEAGDVDLHALLPESPRRAYDVHPLVERCSTPTPRSRSSRPSGRRRWWSASAGCPAGPSACWPTTRCVWAAA